MSKAECQKRWREKNKERLKEYMKEWREKNKERLKEYNKEWKNNNKDYWRDYLEEYSKTQTWRANNLATAYRQHDRIANRGESTLTPEWIIENIFSKPCHYCGKSDWTKIGCDRKDSSLPHTPDNVVPCCCECNKKKGSKSYEEFILHKPKVG